MHPRVIWAIIRKDALDIWLNKPVLGGLIYPIIMSLVFYLISHLVGSSRDSLLVYNPGNSNLAQVLTQAFPNAKVIQAGSADEVATAFGAVGERKKIPYRLGLVLAEDFDHSLQAGTRPNLTLYVNRSSVASQTQALLQTAITNYARAIASPQPPVTINTVVINRS